MRVLLLVLSLLCAGAPSTAVAQNTAAESVEYAMGEDRIATGERVLAGSAVAGDLIVAGGEVRVRAPVGGDLVAAGGDVRIEAAAGQDAYVAGRQVALEAAVRDNARLAGRRVAIGSRANVGGNATVAGGEIDLSGTVQGHLAVAGGRIYLNGRIGGDVEASGGQIRLGPEARIGGELRYRSAAEIERAPGAEVQGAVVRMPAQAPWGEGAEAGLRVAGAFALLWTLGLMILAALFVAVLPGFSAELEDTARARPGMSLLAGIAILIATPLVAAILLASVVGLPLALLLWAAYLAILILGYAGAGAVLGRMGLRRLRPSWAGRTGWRAFAAALAVLLISVLAAVPLVGWLAVLALWLGGMGGLLLQLRSSARRPRSA